jgi:hypothetical protein
VNHITNRNIEKVDRELGNKEGFMSGFEFKSPERGVATHVYAAFEPSLKGRVTPIHSIRLIVHFSIRVDCDAAPRLISSLGYNGAYLQDSHIADPYKDTIRPYAKDSVEASRLWKLSEKLVKQNFDYKDA